VIELIRKSIRYEEGQDLVEYAAIAILPTLGSSVNKVLNTL